MSQLLSQRVIFAKLLIALILTIGGIHTLYASNALMDVRSELLDFADFDKCGSENEKEVFETETDEFVKNQINAVDGQSAFWNLTSGHNLDFPKSQYLLDITTPPPEPVFTLL
ncbi:hypothetical protein QQ020_09670 [Fulvivirgaceae bacterium BMA12]|uniref:Uncharacterized protein n=1 Tax=Agaribacillus aureus TaxID=3051825 RepID=A0ABT8L3K6_9BACT|nr:hypothetical protein [Fulvivirgaceae bacterium BMA12]